MQMPICSIIILNYKGEKIIGKTIESLSQLSYPKDRFEIIIVDNNSRDKSGEIIDSFVKRLSTNDFRFMTFGFRDCEHHKEEDDNNIAHFSVLGRAAIQADHAGPRRTRDGITFDARTVVEIRDQNFFVRKDIRRSHQFLVDRNAAWVINARLGDSHTVDLPTQHLFLHKSSFFRFQESVFKGPLGADYNIIDQPCLADKAGRQCDHALLMLFNRYKRPGIHDLEILHPVHISFQFLDRPSL